MILENSPIVESQSNGSVEIALKEVQWQIRKHKCHFEQNVGECLKYVSQIWPWVICYAGQVIHTFKVYKVDGRPARQRIGFDPSVPEISKHVGVPAIQARENSSNPKRPSKVAVRDLARVH